MADLTSGKHRFRFVNGPQFETRRVSGSIARKNSTGTFNLMFYVERDEMEKTALFDVSEGVAIPESAVLDKEEGSVIELQQAVLLDRVNAIALRDELNRLLTEETP